MLKVAVLGPDGITGKAVINKLYQLKDYTCVENISQSKLIVASPGIPPANYPKTKVPIISEIEFAYRLLRKYSPQTKIVAVTGTNGKTTVTTLLGKLLKAPTAGNIGKPLISFVPHNQQPTINNKQLTHFLVVEVSSYQLEGCQTFRPYAAIWTNLTPDHLARHKTMHGYGKAKFKLLANQKSSDLVIYNADDKLTKQWCNKSKGKKIPFSLKDPFPWNTNLPGDHNKQNIMAAAYTARALGISEKLIASRIRSFTGVEHRIEEVRTVKGITFYNDSKATNPDSTIVALRSFQLPITLILGGRLKDVSYLTLLPEIRPNVKTIVTIGESQKFFAKLVTKLKLPVYSTANMKDAVNISLKHTQPGGVVLLSPACASFDMYNNFEERGRDFKDLVNRLK